MLTRMRKAGLVWLTLLAAAGLAILIGLGTWQLERKAWKEGLIARLSERTHAEPVSLARAEEQWRKTGDVEYLRVGVDGRFLHDKELYHYALDPGRGGPGYHVYTPLVANGRVVWVNRGFVPAELRDPKKRRAGEVEGTVRVVGLARAPAGPGLFTPNNDHERNLWYWRDLDAMTRVAFGGGQGGADVVPFVLEAESEPANQGGWPKGGTTLVQLPNRHLEYSVTWFWLAATLVGVYAAFAFSRLRQAGA